MSSTVSGIRDRGLSWPRLPLTAKRLRSARNLSVEQTAWMAPAWGKIEAPYVRDDRPWTGRGR